MTYEVEYVRFRVRRGTIADLAAANETPLEGEFYAEIDAVPIRAKLGDGVTDYNTLPYFGESGGGGGGSSGAGAVTSLASNSTTVGNVGTGEDDLMVFTVPADTLSEDGQRLVFRASGSIANNANAKRLRVKFGATTLFDSGASGIPTSAALDWVILGEIIRRGVTTQICSVSFTSNNATLASFVDSATAAETLTDPVDLKLTGEATADNDIVQETFTVESVNIPTGASASVPGIGMLTQVLNLPIFL